MQKRFSDNFVFIILIVLLIGVFLFSSISGKAVTQFQKFDILDAKYSQQGTYQVTFIVSDGEFVDSETITITVHGLSFPIPLPIPIE